MRRTSIGKYYEILLSILKYSMRSVHIVIVSDITTIIRICVYIGIFFVVFPPLIVLFYF